MAKQNDSLFVLDMNTVAGFAGLIRENVCPVCGKPVTFKSAFNGLCSQCFMWDNGHTQNKES